MRSSGVVIFKVKYSTMYIYIYIYILSALQYILSSRLPIPRELGHMIIRMGSKNIPLKRYMVTGYTLHRHLTCGL